MWGKIIPKKFDGVFDVWSLFVCWRRKEKSHYNRSINIRLFFVIALRGDRVRKTNKNLESLLEWKRTLSVEMKRYKRFVLCGLRKKKNLSYFLKTFPSFPSLSLIFRLFCVQIWQHCAPRQSRAKVSNRKTFPFLKFLQFFFYFVSRRKENFNHSIKRNMIKFGRWMWKKTEATSWIFEH